MVRLEVGVELKLKLNLNAIQRASGDQFTQSYLAW